MKLVVVRAKSKHSNVLLSNKILSSIILSFEISIVLFFTFFPDQFKIL